MALTNLEVAQAAKLRDIREVADKAGLAPEDYEPLGKYKAKLTDEGIARLRANKGQGKLVLVTAITPTQHGEGKTTVTVGLTQGLNRIGRNAVSATREPALGPIFGTKGGACGGGYSQVVPMEDINLFFTGDFPAITAAHNLLSAILDAHIYHGNALGVDLRQPTWPRTVDMGDRALREIIVGLGGTANGYPRQDGFVITPASEIMAILCLSRDLKELRQRLGSIVAAYTAKKEPITADQLKATGGMMALLKDAIRPNLVQTIEGGLALVHGGPFGNIAHGCSTITATECSLGLSEFTITEAGFASDLGAEKFLNIKCRRLGRGPDAIVLVATIRALEHHGGGCLEQGFQNLLRHAKHLRQYGPPLIVAINRFADDTDEQHCELEEMCAEHGLVAVSCDPFSKGGAGCEELAERVAALAHTPSTFTHLYDESDTFEDKMQAIVTKVYGGDGFTMSDTARKRLEWLRKHNLEAMPVCVAKTQMSLSDDATKPGAPTGFTVHVREIRPSVGAGFLVAVAGDILLIPGLGKSPAAFNIDVDEEGKITGMF
ncbi:MAG TPA: formate--tetrahydrofolate ligase [Fimbriimonas sp.]